MAGPACFSDKARSAGMKTRNAVEGPEAVSGGAGLTLKCHEAENLYQDREKINPFDSLG